MDFSLHNVYNPFVVEFFDHRYLYLAIPALWGAWWLYKREPEGAPRNMRMVLALIRALIIYMALFICLNPTQALELKRSQNKVFLVLVDNSQSMGIKGAEYTADLDGQKRVQALLETQELADVSRLDVARAVLTRALHKKPGTPDQKDLLHALADETNQVKVYGFSRDLVEPQAKDDKTPVDALTAEGDLTDLGGALRKAINQNTGQKIQGILVLTDGKDNAGERVNTVVRRVLGPRKIPAVFVPIGSTVPQPNLEVRAMKHASFFMKGDNPQPIRFEVHVRNYQKPPTLSIELRKTGQGMENKVVDQVVIDPAQPLPEQVRATGQGAFVVYHGTLRDKKPNREGEFQYTVAVKDVSTRVMPELVTEDNSKTKNIPIRNDRIKVLILSDRPNWDFIKLYRFLWRNSGTDGVFKYTAISKEASARWRSEGQPHDPRDTKKNYRISVKDIPRDLESFREKYDVVLLQDLPLPFLEYMSVGQGPSMADLLYRFVTEHAGGLIFQAGTQGSINMYKSHTHHRNKEGELVKGGLADLLPIRIKEGTERGTVVNAGYKIKPTRVGLNHQLMFIGRNQTKSAALWNSMSRNRWYFTPEDVPANCTVLARAQGIPWGKTSNFGAAGQVEDVPLMVVNESAGKGRVFYLGLDDSYLWVFKKPNDVLFNNFWSHVFQWMAAKKLSGFTGNATITIPNQEPRLGDRINVRVEFNSDEVTPQGPTLPVVWHYPGNKETIMLKRSASNRRLFTANQLLTHKGKNAFVYEDPEAKGKSLPSVERLVADRSEELDDPIVSPSDFETYAAANQGLARVYQVDETRAIPGFFRSQRDQVARQTIRGTLLTGKNAFSFFLPFMLLITVEWILRKKYRML